MGLNCPNKWSNLHKIWPGSNDRNDFHDKIFPLPIQTTTETPEDLYVFVFFP
jgi:hypothetical protein